MGISHSVNKRIAPILIFIIPSFFIGGCGAVQQAVYYKPSLKGSEQKIEEYGDGIAFMVDGLCLAVRESPRSAQYNNRFVGPVGAPMFPLELDDPAGQDKPFLEVEIILETEGGNFVFYPDQVKLGSKKGNPSSPSKISYFRDYYYAGVVDSWSKAEKVINLSAPETPRLVHSTTVAFQYPQPAPKADVFYLSIKGIQGTGGEVEVPLVTLEKRSETRYLVSGTLRSNTHLSEVGRICEVVYTKK